jgi:hypothetical protein
MATATQQQAQAEPQQPISSQQAITSRVYARIGLLGNPSDGFYGKTISFSLANFYAEVGTAAAVTAGVSSDNVSPEHLYPSAPAISS